MNSGRQLHSWLSRHPQYIALVIAAALLLWILSGTMQAQDEPPSQQKEQAPTPKVEVTHKVAEVVTRHISLYGKTEPDRMATLKAEVRGRIAEVLVAEGAQVKQGDALVRIEINDLREQLASAKALLAQRKLEHKGAQKLKKKGYQAETQLASAMASLQSAKAQVKALELDIAHTLVRAPFDGVINQRHVEQGDYVALGDPIALLADLDPLIVRADVTEANIAQIQLNQEAQTRLVSGEKHRGKIRYISRVANDATNTFKVEVAIANPDAQLSAGISAELDIPLMQAEAIKVSPAIMALDELGNIGIKKVVEGKVEFVPMQIVKSESDGVWLSGLGSEADVITRGQGFVRAGDEVDVVATTKVE